MGTDREIIVYGFRAYMTSSRLCTASSPFRPKIAAPRIRLEDAVAEKHLAVLSTGLWRGGGRHPSASKAHELRLLSEVEQTSNQVRFCRLSANSGRS